MDFSFTEDQLLLRDGLREVLAGECPASVLRQAWAHGPVEGLWRSLAENGLVGASVSEAFGGLGFTPIDWVLLFEEVGRAAVPEPVLDTTAVVVPVLEDLGSAELKAQWLPAIAAGEVKCAVAMGTDPVPYAAEADAVLVLEAKRVLWLERGGFTTSEQAAVDGGRRPATLAFDDAAGIELAAGLDAVRAGDLARRLGALASSAELIGLASHLMDESVAYVKRREQFGRPIGSFQAIKHLLANALVDLEFARPMVYRAAWSLSSVDTDPLLAEVAVSSAKSLSTDAAQQVARAALQCHGAMGYSYECDLHLWLKRVWARAVDWGDARHHRARVADRVIGPCQ